MNSISTIHKIRIPVKDLKRATEFYKNILDLNYQYTVNEIAYFKLDSIEIQLNPKLNTPSSEIFYFLSNISIENFYQKLISGGAKEIEPPNLTNLMKDRNRWQAILLDTEGNRFGIIEEKESDY